MVRQNGPHDRVIALLPPNRKVGARQIDNHIEKDLAWIVGRRFNEPLDAFCVPTGVCNSLLLLLRACWVSVHS